MTTERDKSQTNKHNKTKITHFSFLLWHSTKEWIASTAKPAFHYSRQSILLSISNSSNIYHTIWQ